MKGGRAAAVRATPQNGPMASTRIQHQISLIFSPFARNGLKSAERALSESGMQIAPSSSSASCNEGAVPGFPRLSCPKVICPSFFASERGECNPNLSARNKFVGRVCLGGGANIPSPALLYFQFMAEGCISRQNKAVSEP